MFKIIEFQPDDSPAMEELKRTLSRERKRIAEHYAANADPATQTADFIKQYQKALADLDQRATKEVRELEKKEKRQPRS